MKGSLKISLLSQEQMSKKQFPALSPFIRQSWINHINDAIDQGFSFAQVRSNHKMSFTSAELDDISDALISHLGGESLTIWGIGHPNSYTIYLAYRRDSDTIELF